MRYFWIMLISLLVLNGCAATAKPLPLPYYQYHSIPRVQNSLGNKEYKVYLDKDLNNEQIAVFNKVISDWNHVLNGYETITISSLRFNNHNVTQIRLLESLINEKHHGIIVFCYNQNDYRIKKSITDEDGNPDSKLAFVDGLGNDAKHMYVIKDRVVGHNLHKILLHEFGHALGADHTQALSLMFPEYSDKIPDCIDKITVAQVAYHNRFKLEQMNYCSTPNFE